MKRAGEWIIVAAAVLMLIGCVPTEPSVNEDDLGLSKTSVFETPDPIVPSTTANDPGENATQAAYFSESPPVIPHRIEEFLPIRIDENLCMECHDAPDRIGETLEEGEAVPAPASHYTDLRNKPDEVTQTMIGARFTCTHCHAPQADVDPLVANTYRQ